MKLWNCKIHTGITCIAQDIKYTTQGKSNTRKWLTRLADIIKGMIKLVHSGYCKYIVKDSSFEVLTT